MGSLIPWTPGITPRVTPMASLKVTLLATPKAMPKTSPKHPMPHTLSLHGYSRGGATNLPKGQGRGLLSDDVP